MFGNPLFALGTLGAFAVTVGFLGDRLRMPRVTSYLLAGVLVGPSVLALISLEELHHFTPIADLAMALVLFNLGSHFSLVLLAKIRAHIVPVAIGELTLTALVVTLGLLLFGVGLVPSMMLGCLAMATAPATTVLVLKDLKSEGPVTESTQALVAINNLVTILVFELFLVALVVFGGDGSLSIGGQIESSFWTFLGSTLLGIALGLLLSFVAGFLNTMQWVAVLIAASMLGLGICGIDSSSGGPLMSYMLTFLVMGFVFANTAADSEQDLVESEKLTSLLCVAFFAIHGAELRLDQFMQMGAIGTAYIVLRILGKYFGIRIAASLSHESLEMRDWLGATMLSQAGAAIALAGVAASRDSATFESVQTVILGSVIVFEILGPLMIRAGVVNSGEVPIAHVARHSDSSIVKQIRSMWWKLRTSTGEDPAPTIQASDMTVGSLTRTRVTGIRQDAQLAEIISHIEHSSDQTFPVVNRKNQVVGIIRYPILSETLFYPHVGRLICAEDLATDIEQVVYADQPVSDVYDYFMQSHDDCIPVLSREESKHMEGVVRRSDLQSILIRKQKRGSGH